MKPRTLFTAMLLAILLSALSVSAGVPTLEHGEVLYHQNFAVASDLSATGITKGTAGSAGFSFSLREGQFFIDTKDNGRGFAILPSTARTQSFTIEVTFSFYRASDNGYLGIILTSSGKEPGNLSQVILRARGDVDDFSPMSNAMASRIQAGVPTTVKIPVTNGAIESLTLTADGLTEELQRESLLVIGPGNCGFSARNVGVNISEVFIVNGTGYSEKTGHWATDSYSSFHQGETESSPDTADAPVTLLSGIALLSALSFKRLIHRKKCPQR